MAFQGVKAGATVAFMVKWCKASPSRASESKCLDDREDFVVVFVEFPSSEANSGYALVTISEVNGVGVGHFKVANDVD
jgi:hypothetical protein